MSALADSYAETLKAVRATGSVWIRTEDGWCHTYDKDEVKSTEHRLEAAVSSLRQ